MKKYRAICFNDKQKESGLMFILNEEYVVSKFNGNVFYEYVVVEGKFKNTETIYLTGQRVFDKKTCEKHLKIIK